VPGGRKRAVHPWTGIFRVGMRTDEVSLCDDRDGTLSNWAGTLTLMWNQGSTLSLQHSSFLES
jgi:hypothetical protein